jgi:hypothetical protein
MHCEISMAWWKRSGSSIYIARESRKRQKKELFWGAHYTNWCWEIQGIQSSVFSKFVSCYPGEGSPEASYNYGDMIKGNGMPEWRRRKCSDIFRVNFNFEGEHYKKFLIPFRWMHLRRNSEVNIRWPSWLGWSCYFCHEREIMLRTYQRFWQE